MLKAIAVRFDQNIKVLIRGSARDVEIEKQFYDCISEEGLDGIDFQVIDADYPDFLPLDPFIYYLSKSLSTKLITCTYDSTTSLPFIGMHIPSIHFIGAPKFSIDMVNTSNIFVEKILDHLMNIKSHIDLLENNSSIKVLKIDPTFFSVDI